jgi:deoxyxylulose-5-phosphate synthase
VALLDSIKGPADLRSLRPDQLPQLAQEIRDFLITSVTRTGGHLGPNLGVVELTIAIHRVFDSPRDAVVWDTGHQAYVHKLLTGRQDFERLRTKGGLSGYPQPLRVTARHRRKLPRLDGPVVGGWDRQGAPCAGRAGSAYRRGHR